MGDATIHVVPGPSSAACLQEGLGLARDQILIHNDVLSCGPLRPLSCLEDWRNLRREYLRSFGPDWFPVEEDDRDLLTQPDRLREARTITLWLGTGLAEQLMLLWVVDLLRRLGVDLGGVRVVQYNLHRNHEVVGIGVLSPSRFKEHPQPTRLDETATHDLVRAWEAVTASEPEKLLAFLNSEHRSLPFLNRGLSSLLYHYPDVSTGLNAWEYQLLRYVREEGPKAVGVVAHTMAHDMSFPEWMGDSYLFQRLHRFADGALARPLLTLSGDDTTRLRGTEVRFTEHGAAILGGEGNAVEWNGIDDWVGGVHLDSRGGRVWFREGQTLISRS
jgi:hypothetical protein